MDNEQTRTGQLIERDGAAMAGMDMDTVQWAAADQSASLPSPQNPDAMEWAKAFCDTFPRCGASEDLMVGWFANAMMAMHDHLLNTRTGQLVPRDAVEGVVTQFDWDAAIEADDGAINAARSLSDRMCGASQSEMRQARKTYLAEAFARHRITALASIKEAGDAD